MKNGTGKTQPKPHRGLTTSSLAAANGIGPTYITSDAVLYGNERFPSAFDPLEVEVRSEFPSGCDHDDTPIVMRFEMLS